MQVLDGQDSEAVHQDSSKENNFLGAHLFGIREVVLKNLTPVPDCWYPQAPPLNRLLHNNNGKDLEEVASNAKENVENSVEVGFSSELSSNSGRHAFPLPTSDLRSRPNYVAGTD